MAERTTNPFPYFNFHLEIDGVARAGFSEVSIAETAIEAIDYREGPPHVRKVPGLTKHSSVTLKRGLANANLLKLFDKRRNVTIVTLDERGKTIARFVITGAWPTKYDRAT